MERIKYGSLEINENKRFSFQNQSSKDVLWLE